MLVSVYCIIMSQSSDLLPSKRGFHYWVCPGQNRYLPTSVKLAHVAPERPRVKKAESIPQQRLYVYTQKQYIFTRFEFCPLRPTIGRGVKYLDRICISRTLLYNDDWQKMRVLRHNRITRG